MRLIPNYPELGWTPYAWLLYSVPFLWALISQPLPARTRALYAFGFAIFLALYFTSYWVHGKKLVAVIVATASLAASYSLTPFRFYGATLFIYAAAMVAFVDMQRPQVRNLVLYLTGVGIFGLVTDQPQWFYLPAVFIAGVVGALNIHYAQTWIANGKIRLAQEEVERLAKIAERERIARDLHDVLGHTLSVIALKSELAMKLMERDPARAAQEIRRRFAK
jgi:two-component system, NarL family, sensor histidine kinase DesK